MSNVTIHCKDCSKNENGVCASYADPSVVMKWVKHYNETGKVTGVGCSINNSNIFKNESIGKKRVGQQKQKKYRKK